VSPSTKKAQRTKARARYERYLERRAHKQRRQLFWRRVGIGALIFVLLAGMGYIGLRLLAGGGDDTGPAPTAAPTPVQPVVDGCDKVTLTPNSDPQQFAKAGQALEAGKPASLSLQTNCGDIEIALDTEDAPNTSNALAFLANAAWYDGSSCHRLTTAKSGIYVLQCGDPTGTGAGGPGFTTKDENVPKDGSYPAGTVAMAEAAGSDAGSQFFIVYKDTTLPADYTVVGQVTAGLDIVKKVADAGVTGGAGDGTPAQPVVIQRATVQQGSSPSPSAGQG
jgi:peptidyl-prolyl cis-trans isomerase B (cyclophilin B)